MEKNNILIGSHLSLKAPLYYIDLVNEAISYNENTFMFYTGAPNNSRRIETSRFNIKEGQEILKKHNINNDNLVVHAPYIINLGNLNSDYIFNLSVSTLKSEIKRTSDFNIKRFVLHPGSSLDGDRNLSLKNVSKGLNLVLDNDDTDVIIALETMAGKGSELGKTLEELKTIIDGVNKKERVGVCLDTCHLFDGGYDIKNFDSFLDQFDKIIGINKIMVVHVNDSKNQFNSHKDRHENIGKGNIGLDILKNIVNNQRLKNVPKILETPYLDGKPIYKEEIELLTR